MMVRLLAQVIARGSDEILPSHIQADRLDAEPLLKSGVAVFKRLDLDGYVCRDCAGYEDCFRVYNEIGKDGRKHIYRVCRDEPEEVKELALSDVTVYGVSISAVFRLVSEVFGCGEPQPVANVTGVWDFGMSKFAPGKHKRRVFFVRHLAKIPKTTFAAYPGCIVIAAGGLKPVEADASLFSFEDVFRYDANGLALDLDAVSLRFEQRTCSNKSPRKPNKAMLAKMKALANHLKDLAGGFMKARRSGTQTAYAQVAAGMSKITMPSLTEFFKSDNAPCKISRSVLHEYLSGAKYADEPYATAARFWYKACTRMDVLEAVSQICVSKFGSKVNSIFGMDASQVYMKIVKFLPPEMR